MDSTKSDFTDAELAMIERGERLPQDGIGRCPGLVANPSQAFVGGDDTAV